MTSKAHEIHHKGIHRMTVEKHPDGFVVEMHHEQKERGVYKEPTTKIAKHHGEVMHHLHEFTKHGGSEEPAEGEHACPLCTGEGKKSEERE